MGNFIKVYAHFEFDASNLVNVNVTKLCNVKKTKQNKDIGKTKVTWLGIK